MGHYVIWSETQTEMVENSQKNCTRCLKKFLQKKKIKNGLKKFPFFLKKKKKKSRFFFIIFSFNIV